MTQPQYAPQAPQQGYPQQPQQWAPPAPQGYQQAPAQPGYPQPPQQPFAPQGFNQGFQQPYPQQGYPQGQAQQPAPELAAGSLDAYWTQPSVGGGAALKFPVDGTTHVGIVSREVTDADVQQQTQKGTNLPATYRDGRPKFVMKVPLQVQPTQDNPDGQAQWWVQGAARDELVRAMAEAGAPAGPPEAGALIQVTRTGQRQIPNMNPANVYSVRYQRPDGAAPAQQQAPAAPPAPAPAPEQPQFSQPMQTQGFADPAPMAQQAQPPAPPQQMPPTPAQMPQQQAQPPAPAPAAAPPAPGAPADLNAEQQALLARLTGAPQG